MSPIEILLSTLGSCISISARLFANSLKIDLQDFRINLTADLKPVIYTKDGERFIHVVKEIKIDIHIKAIATPELLIKFKQMLKNRCPVAATVANEVKLSHNFIVE